MNRPEAIEVALPSAQPETEHERLALVAEKIGGALAVAPERIRVCHSSPWKVAAVVYECNPLIPQYRPDADPPIPEPKITAVYSYSYCYALNRWIDGDPAPGDPLRFVFDDDTPRQAQESAQ